METRGLSWWRTARPRVGHRLGALALCLSFSLLVSCQSPSRQARLVVFAASSLAEPFEVIAGRFEAEHPGLDVALNLAGSQQLAHQINQGAPADVFASADPAHMAGPEAAGRVAVGAARPFAGNRLVVVYPATNPAGVTELRDLARPGLRLVLATPEAPAGAYARRFLAQTAAEPEFDPSFEAAALANVVSYEENVRAVLGKVLLGEADVGIVYESDALSVDPGRIGVLDIPSALNVVASYAIAPLADTPRPGLAADFVAFVLGPEGQSALVERGFLPAAGVAGP